MIDTNTLPNVIGCTVYDSDGDKVGTANQVYVHPDTNQPTWVSIRTGLFGTSESFAPLDDATFDGEALSIPYQKDFIKDAPRVDDDGSLSDEEENTLYAYYDKADTTGNGTDTYANRGAGFADRDFADRSVSDRDVSDRDLADRDTAARDTSGPNTDDAMTRSEERLRVGTENVETGRARLKKFIVTEQQTVNADVRHDEARVVREPITDSNAGAALGGPELSEEEVEVVLTADRVVVDKDVVPVERIRLDKETVTEQQSVTEDVRKEQVDVLDPTTDRGADRRTDDDGVDIDRADTNRADGNRDTTNRNY